MLAHARRSAAPRLLVTALASLLCLAAAGREARAQVGAIDSDPAQAIGNRFTARNSVEGIVYHPSGQPLDRRVKVRISGATGGTLFTQTDDNGAFVFRRLAGGTYYLTVDAGEGFARAEETVDIIDPSPRSGRGTTVNVHVQLRYAERRREAKPGVINAALADVPKPALELYQAALDAAAAGDAKKAVEKLKDALKHHPRFMLAFNELGVQFMRLNQLTEAEAALRSAVQIAPEDYNPRFNLGLVFLRRKQFAESAAELRLALKSKPSAAPARMHLGRALIGLGRYAEAEAEMRQAVDLGGPEVNEAHRYLGAIYIELADTARAISSLEKYLALEPKAKDADSIRKILEQLRSKKG